MLVAAARVAGLVDWTEAHVDSFAYELANGVWEFCKDEDDFDRDRAGEFVSLYSEAGGVATAEEQAEALLAVPIPGWRASPAIRGKRPVDAPSVNSERTDELLVPLIRCRLVVEVVREIRLNVPDAEWNYALHLLRSLVNVG